MWIIIIFVVLGVLIIFGVIMMISTNPAEKLYQCTYRNPDKRDE